MTMESLPLILFQVGVDVGDIEYIEGKVIAGDYFQVSGDINAINDTIEFVPATGKTAFLIEAKIVPTGHSNPPQLPATTANTVNNNRVQAQLLIDSAVKDTANVGTVFNATAVITEDAGAGAGGGNQNKDKFNVLGLSLVGNSVKKIEIKNTLDNGSAFATMSGYVI